MKANCALALEVLRTLSELNLNPKFGVTIVLTCDEEVGSVTGWPLIEQVAKAQNDALRLCAGTAGIRRSSENWSEGNRNLCDQELRESCSRRTRTGERRERDSRTRAPN